MFSYNSRLNKALEKLSVESSNDFLSPEEYEQRKEELRMREVPKYLWAYYLNGYKKYSISDLPYFVDKNGSPSASPSRILSNGDEAKVNDTLQYAFVKSIQDEIIDWIEKHLQRNIRGMKVYQVMRIIRQYTETSQKQMEAEIKDPFGVRRGRNTLHRRSEDTFIKPEDFNRFTDY